MNNNFDTDDFDIGWLRFPVSHIHICGYTNLRNEGDEDGNPPTNHWALFLQVSEDASIRLDMTPGYGSDGQRGKIQILYKEYTYTNNAIKSESFQVRSGVVAQHITDLITLNGRDKYTFTEEQEGCRFWIFTVISDLEARGFIATGCSQNTWTAVSHYWRYPSGRELREVKRGTFYT